MLPRSTYVIRYITQSRARTTAVGFGRLRGDIREAIDYINEIQTVGRHRRVRLRAVPGRDDLRRQGTDVGSDRRPPSSPRRPHPAPPPHPHPKNTPPNPHHPN